MLMEQASGMDRTLMTFLNGMKETK